MSAARGVTSRMINSAGRTLRCVGGANVEVLPCPDGPMLVRGASMIIDEDGERHEVLRPVVALCRCGTSTDPPWCDGMHKLLRLRDDQAKVGPLGS